ncbi:lambda exonuclease family protein [Pseudomonas oryzihabitans]|uniref:lambda exonuclease family protein n=1 Tax=Pseudomonas oryzihabitans TaxID=47885 RepID=UPI0028A7832A|nr:YqaJ viral recombinase family protein [Pseudomonas oryzihabitans]
MQLLDLEQGSEAWLAARLGIITASEVKSLLVKGQGERGFGADAISYMDQLIGERITGVSADAFGGNRHTERGHLMEPVARKLYADTEECQVDQVGIILNHGIGYSPDGLVGSDGLVEIKTKLPKIQVGVILAGEIPKEHIAQCQAGLWVSEREWIDFISYWPGMPLFVKRAYRDDELIAKIQARVLSFYELLDERMNRVLGVAA